MDSRNIVKTCTYHFVFFDLGWHDDWVQAVNWEAAKVGIKAIVGEASWVMVRITDESDNEIWNLST